MSLCSFLFYSVPSDFLIDFLNWGGVNRFHFILLLFLWGGGGGGEIPRVAQ